MCTYREKEHVYGKLAPQAVNSTLLAEDGEANFTTKDKKSPSDFALWKAAKPGEPSWPAPKCAQDAAATGRPGQPARLASPLFTLPERRQSDVWKDLSSAPAGCVSQTGDRVGAAASRGVSSDKVMPIRCKTFSAV